MRPLMPAGPARLTLVRHGHSVGNLADQRAREAGADVLDLETRDADVELSDTGREQAEALRSWLREQDEPDRPTVVISSPYRRAAETARLTLDGTGLDLVLDERLRERDLGVLDGMTGKGIRSTYPQEAERRDKLGKFYYQPPSGESWADVALRVRSLLHDLREGYDGERVWLFSHQAVIMTFRYVLEGLSEQDLLEVDRQVQIPNASLTSYRREGDLLELVTFADAAPVEAAAGAAVTREPSQGGRGDEQA